LLFEIQADFIPANQQDVYVWLGLLLPFAFLPLPYLSTEQAGIHPVFHHSIIPLFHNISYLRHEKKEVADIFLKKVLNP
jgi:hypothetical protein